jgi:adenine-specific DNA-methyltransferase
MQMAAHEISQPTSRYRAVVREKAQGVTYTPEALADFVAAQIVGAIGGRAQGSVLRVLDPALGQGQLLASLVGQLVSRSECRIEMHGFETDPSALAFATQALSDSFPNVPLRLRCGDFLKFVLDEFGANGDLALFRPPAPARYDVIIANPPYVRTQIMGAEQARALARRFGLTGRVDLYHAFLLAMAEVLSPDGVAGVIVSNRFMTTKAGAAVRRAIRRRFHLRHVWDLGDTKLFDAAVLPAVLLLEGRHGQPETAPGFSSVYETTEATSIAAAGPIAALDTEGIVEVPDGRRFRVQHGHLDTGGVLDGVWRIANARADAWLLTVESHTWGRFADIGKIRVGVKTCADSVFIRSDWDDLPERDRPELLRPLTTHRAARRFRALQIQPPQRILYPHEAVFGRRQAVNLSRYPRSRAYLERNREILEARTYVLEAGRQWYEIWVPQDPAAWDEPKLVFRDIAEQPTFWVDKDRTVVNGDCYWLICDQGRDPDLLWLAAAVGNSTFIEAFYDHRFHNKLYAGRRRFMTQYVAEFPLPDPRTPYAQTMVAKAKELHAVCDQPQAEALAEELESLVWEGFGLQVKETSG